MKHIKLTVLDRDVDSVIECLGRRGLMQFSRETFAVDGPGKDGADKPGVYKHIEENLEKIKAGAVYLEVELSPDPGEDSKLPGEEDAGRMDAIIGDIDRLRGRESEETAEKSKIEDALNEAKAFANLNAPYSELDQLSYLTLRVGRLDVRKQEELKVNLADRAVIIPLGGGDRVLAAASRKGRFALDSELKKHSFVPIAIPEGYTGVPAELLSGLEDRLSASKQTLAGIAREKLRLKDEYGPDLRRLFGDYRMAIMVEDIKGKLRATKETYVLSGWVPEDSVKSLVEDLEKHTGGRTAIRAFNPDEIEEVRAGREKVPVSLEHGSFIKGFERVVFSYGAPLYGTVDPTPFVAFSFTVLFGIMFGDLGQGLVLLLLGVLMGRTAVKALASFRHFSAPLIAVGAASMVMGLLNGAVFTNETLLEGPTLAVTGFLTGHPVERILRIMPERGSVEKLFYFFGFTLAVGVIFNSIGLLVNIVNQCILKRYEKAFFAKTGLAGVLLFWYAVFIALRLLFGGRFAWIDSLGIGIPLAGIFFGPVVWRIVSGERPVLEQGFMVFIVEGFVEILETVSTYVSNTVSFLRVGAFALSHAVLSFIIFTLSEMVSDQMAGPVLSFIIMAAGNTVIILLEGMIVAIQVVRLQYYEFFSKFFTETGVEFAPFRFHGGVVPDKVRDPHP
jgi:V/A-type H+-transporting ATPase subunit I